VTHWFAPSDFFRAGLLPVFSTQRSCVVHDPFLSRSCSLIYADTGFGVSAARQRQPGELAASLDFGAEVFRKSTTLPEFAASAPALSYMPCGPSVTATRGRKLGRQDLS
jgi:hypothetical protein